MIVTGCTEQSEIEYTRFAIGATFPVAPKVTRVLCRHVVLGAVSAVRAALSYGLLDIIC